MIDLTRLLTEFYRTPWMMHPQILTTMGLACQQAMRSGNAETLYYDVKNLTVARGVRQPVTTPGGVAVLPIQGAIGHRTSFWSDVFGWPTTESLGDSIRQLAETAAVSAIVLDIDSPGGIAVGNEELHQIIMEARARKPIIAIANGLAASAAYYIASAASEIVVIPSGDVGSIGCVALHLDESKFLEDSGLKVTVITAGKYKWEGHAFEPLGDEARAEIQRGVDRHYGLFINAVARGRGVTTDVVERDFGQGRMLPAANAVKAGMADRLGTLETTLVALGVKRHASGFRMADIERLRIKNRLLGL